MKVLKKGKKLRKYTRKPWVGLIVRCMYCRGRFKLASHDRVRNNGRLDGFHRYFFVKCPTYNCGENIHFLVPID